MAKSGDKRRLEENKNHIQKLKILIAVANAVYIGSRFVLQRQPVFGWHSASVGLTTLLYTLCYSGIASSLAPHYSTTGELIYSGADLSQGGVLSYYHDVLYICIFCQILGAYTNYAWLAMLSIPAYGLYKLVAEVLLPSWTRPTDVPESDTERKRREKRERQAARVEKFAANRRK